MSVIWLITLLFMIYYFPAQFTLKLLKFGKVHYSKAKNKSITVGEAIACCIPMWQNTVVRQVLRKTPGIVAPLSVVGFFSVTVGTVLTYIGFGGNIWVCVAGLGILCLGIILHQITYIITYFDIALMCGFGMVFRLAVLAFPEFTAYYCGTAVIRELKEIEQERKLRYAK